MLFGLFAYKILVLCSSKKQKDSCIVWLVIGIERIMKMII